MNSKHLNEVLDFCDEQNLINKTSEEISYLYDMYMEQMFETFVEDF